MDLRRGTMRLRHADDAIPCARALTSCDVHPSRRRSISTGRTGTNDCSTSSCRPGTRTSMGRRTRRNSFGSRVPRTRPAGLHARYANETFRDYVRKKRINASGPGTGILTGNFWKYWNRNPFLNFIFFFLIINRFRYRYLSLENLSVLIVYI